MDTLALAVVSVTVFGCLCYILYLLRARLTNVIGWLIHTVCKSRTACQTDSVTLYLGPIPGVCEEPIVTAPIDCISSASTHEHVYANMPLFFRPQDAKKNMLTLDAMCILNDGATIALQELRELQRDLSEISAELGIAAADGCVVSFDSITTTEGFSLDPIQCCFDIANAMSDISQVRTEVMEMGDTVLAEDLQSFHSFLEMLRNEIVQINCSLPNIDESTISVCSEAVTRATDAAMSVVCIINKIVTELGGKDNKTVK